MIANALYENPPCSGSSPSLVSPLEYMTSLKGPLTRLY